MSSPRPSVRRKIAVATWTAPRDGRLYARMALDATPVLDYCARRRAESGVKVTPGVVVGMAFHRGVLTVPEFHHRVVFGRITPYTTHDVAFAVDIDDGDDLAPTKVHAIDTKTVTEVARELEAGAVRLRARTDRNYEVSSGIAGVVPWWALRTVLSTVSLVNGGIGLPAFGQPAHPLGSMFVTNIGSFGLDEGYVAPVPLARVPLYVCVGAVHDAPMAVDGEVVVRPQLVITATADHRLVDGSHAAKLGRFVRAALADPDGLDVVRAASS